jgi:uncharacterized protein (TIGR02147 family)
MLVDRKFSPLEYTDYRTYIQDVIKAHKEAGIKLTNRWFAQRMEINSSSWLTSVLLGKKGLSTQSANRISWIFGHNKLETLYFDKLVRFNQAKNDERRNAFYQEIVKLKKSRKAITVKEDQYEFYTRWYHSVVRSLIGLFPVKDNYREIAEKIRPEITPAQVKKSIQLLERLELIRKNRKGEYELTSNVITSGEKVASLAVTNFQRETMRLASESLDRCSGDIRDISTQTVGISSKCYQDIVQLAREFRKQVSEMANADEAADRVYQLNIQLFPLSETNGQMDS